MLVVAALWALAAAPAADARIVIVKDRGGRPITFDVRVPGASVEFYARLLRDAAHGEEVRRVTIQIVPVNQTPRLCHTSEATGCYTTVNRRGLIILPNRSDAVAAHALLHEYAHHLDAWRGVRGVPEPNGSAKWWKARGMARHVRLERVADDYSRGWDRAIGEIFAEDYARVHLELPYRIGWLSPPGPAIRDALRRDIPGIPEVSGVPPPLLITRNGLLAPGKLQSIPFGLLGPRRRVKFSVALYRTRPEATARVVLSCAGRNVAHTLSHAKPSVTIEEPGLGPTDPREPCRATLVNTGAGGFRFALRLRITIDPR